MFGLFKKDPTRKLKKEYNAKMERARDLQRAGKIQEYAAAVSEAEALYCQIQERSPQNGAS